MGVRQVLWFVAGSGVGALMVGSGDGPLRVAESVIAMVICLIVIGAGMALAERVEGE